jgi:hypothetical protein
LDQMSRRDDRGPRSTLPRVRGHTGAGHDWRLEMETVRVLVILSPPEGSSCPFAWRQGGIDLPSARSVAGPMLSAVPWA